MKKLRFPMFAGLFSSERTNRNTCDMLDNTFMISTAPVVKLPNETELQEEKNLNLINLLPEPCTTCQYHDELGAEEIIIEAPADEQANYKFLGGYNSLALEINSLREFKIQYKCPDCSTVHHVSSGSCVITNAYRIRFQSHTVFSNFESFPDEFAYIGKEKDMHIQRPDWYMINNLYDMLDEPLDRESIRKFKPKRWRSQFPVLEESAFQEKFVLYCVRYFTLADHMEIFYGKQNLSIKKCQDSFSKFLLKDAFRHYPVESLSNFFFNNRSSFL